MSAAHLQELASWVRLAQTAGVGPETARRLLATFGLPDNIFAASQQALNEVVTARIAAALVGPMPATTSALIERTLQWAGFPGNHVVTLADTAYPARLLEIADPPILLYVKGRLELLSSPSVAVVGSRNATAQGLANAEEFALALAEAGLTIVSGLALGIDAAAHRGGLRGASGVHGSTVAVIGTGADIVYPSRNRGLAHEIAAAGCIVTEYPLGMPAIAANFPRRNRIISGLARGVLVIEAAARSGSLITARMAAEQGRDVFAVPGSIHAPLAKGCHQLIRQGAKLVETAQDVLEELQGLGLQAMPVIRSPKLLYRTPSRSATVADAASDDPVLLAMGFEPVAHDVLAERCSLDSAVLSVRLLALELEGLVALLPGGAFQRLQ